MHKVKEWWSLLRSSFWFLPALIVAMSVALAIALVSADSAWSDRWLAKWPRLFGVRPDGARQLLTTVAGSMMTVMGVTFSMTLVALSLASSQYSSRILNTFIRSRVTQSTLGIFSGIFTYCLIVLHTIRGGDDEVAFVPGLALFCAFLFAVGGVGVFIYFIHHIASSIQASNIITAVANETISVIERIFPQRAGLGADKDQLESCSPVAEEDWHAVLAQSDGYIQDVNDEALMYLVRKNQMSVRMERGIGEFVARNTAFVSIAAVDQPDQETLRAVHAAFSIGIRRTVAQDPAFGIRQIVDIAMRALSPGVNDTSTAIICVDYLSAILARLATRALPSPYRHGEGDVQVIVKGPSFESLVGSAFDQIRRNADGNVALLSRLLSALDTVASQTLDPQRRSVLARHLQWMVDLIDRSVDSVCDRDRLEGESMPLRKALGLVPSRWPA